MELNTEETKVNKKRRQKLTLKKKAVLLIIAFSVVLITVACWISSRVIINMTRAHFRDKATEVAGTIAEVIDAEKFARLKAAVEEIYNGAENKVGSDEWGSDAFNAYSALFSGIEQTEDFITMRDDLRKFAEINQVDCIYLVFVDVAAESWLYVVDSAEEDACPPGCIDELISENKPILTDPEYGFPAYQTNTAAYGALMTAGVAIHDADGKVIGYVCTDITMDEVRHSGFLFAMRLLGWLVLTLALFCIGALLLIDKLVVKPIKQLSTTADNYCREDDSSPFHSGFEKLDIHTGDEIQTLSDSMKQMESDLNRHVARLIQVNNELSKTQTFATEMTRLANVDSLTGVKNKTAYDRDAAELDARIGEGTAEFGIAMIDLNGMKKTNDKYGHECGNESIVGLSKVICGVFVHSPVYRIGGDEFVVILKNHDFRKRDTLIDLFKKDIDILRNDETLQPWKRISAAIGFAAFDADSDLTVRDVFCRADDEMYKNKAEMKKMMGEA